MTSIGWNGSLTQMLSGRLTQRLIPFINAGLVIVLAYSLTQLTWLAWPALPPADRPPVLQTITHSSAAPTGPTHTSLAALHLFGEPQAENIAGSTPPVAVPQTPLRLILKGIIASQDAHNARAIIADAAGKEDSYAVNAQLPEDAVLKEIYVDHIILTRNHQDEALALVKDSLTTGSAEVKAAQPGNLPTALSAGGIQNPEAQGISPPNAGGGATGSTAQSADIGAALRNYRDVLAANPQSLVGLAQADPVHEGTKFKGYRIQPGSDPGLFSNLGFQPGDVVTAVNGVALDNPAKAFEIMQNLATASELQVVVERNGESKTLGARINE